MAHVPEVLDHPTHYAFAYDGLGRMTAADGVVGDLVNGLTDAADNRFDVGDERYTFDRVGNLRTMRRTGLYMAEEPMPGTVDWTYHYGPGNDRLQWLVASGNSAMPSRSYTYDKAGNLLTDDARQMTSTRYGYNNLPSRVTMDSNNGQRKLDLLYGPSDQRIYKSSRVEKDVESQEFHLYDAQGRALGVVDLNGSELDPNGNPTGAWTWYAFGHQRFAKVTPPPSQQPQLYTSDLGSSSEADAEEVFFISLTEFLQVKDAQPSGIVYPLYVVAVQFPNGDCISRTLVEHQAASLIDPTIEQFVTAVLKLYTPQDMVSLRRYNGEKPISISVEELIGIGKSRALVDAVPFVYTSFADTRLQNICFYLFDHLGNTRVTYTAGCTRWDDLGNTERVFGLEHAVDYYPNGSILREYVNGRKEKYLTTQHERDQETGLDYRGARYFDSDVARFLSLDPMATKMPQWSAYNYVVGNPVSVIDPDGRDGWDIIKGAFAAVWDNTLAMPGTDIRSNMSYSNAAQYNLGQDIGDRATMIGGAIMTVAGLVETVQGAAIGLTGGALTGATAGAGSPVTVPVAAAGIAVAAQGIATATAGGYIVLNAKGNLDSQKGRVSEPSPTKTPRKSSEQLRKEWEKANDKPWPKDKATGKNQDVSHKKPLADGGDNSLPNIEPLPRKEHLDLHKKAGDFKRWGARSIKPKTE